MATALPLAATACDTMPNFIQFACNRADQIWTEGSSDLYLSGWAWHNRNKYAASTISRFREFAVGGGYGRSLYDADGDWHGVYAMAFLDSHSNVQPVAGYGYQYVGRFGGDFRLGAGYTLFVTARKDMMHYIPFPAALPLVSAGYKKANIYATYIPGGHVLYMFARWSF
ncbi:lipid IV(A) palmitoyltransferase PagP [Bordetella sp. LUAb4]|uniref:lipid IV(A) palmitoyltransferase PagP n=1 Tax=Bordetella sp. LUAb4 TaxID=2843195 RepID=UPI001E3023D9|nr:lipid IV(A) palmitoyltransferase PagP [Bordetella sp. LUAb4]